MSLEIRIRNTFIARYYYWDYIKAAVLLCIHSVLNEKLNHCGAGKREKISHFKQSVCVCTVTDLLQGHWLGDLVQNT